MYTEYGLLSLVCGKLREILTAMGQPTTGLKKDLVERILTEQGAKPEVTLYMEAQAVEPVEDGAEVDDPAAADFLTVLQTELRLADATVQLLRNGDFATLAELKEMSKEQIAALPITLREICALQNRLHPAVQPQQGRTIVNLHPPAAGTSGTGRNDRYRPYPATLTGESEQ
jgi:hypothetical protein